jgi:2-hydroxy-6-oxonona-2,4-dienedioate hydrolase
MVGISSPLLFIEIDGIRTGYYRKTPPQAANGQAPAPTLILLHGGAPGACADLNWFQNFDVLADAGYDVVAYDQPGFGHSAAPADHSIEFRYRHALAFMKSLEVDAVHLVGNSIGGLLSTLLSHRLKAGEGPRIKSMVLAAPFPYFDPPEAAKTKLQQHRARLGSIEATFDSVRSLCLNTFSQARQVSDEIVNLRLSMLQGDRWSAYQQRSQVSREFDQEEIRNTQLATPTLMIWGLNDRSLPCEIGLEAFNYFTNARFLFLPDCGHWPQTECAPAFNQATLQFLSEQL